MTVNVLFICTQNLARSPTAEQIFSDWPGIETSSAGMSPDAEKPVTPELLQWADIVFVMEQAHCAGLSVKYEPHVGGKRVVCLEIPDVYGFMDPDLIRLLKAKVPRHLPP